LIKSIFKVLGYGLLALATLDIAARIDDAVTEGAAFWQPYTLDALFRPSEFGREGIPGKRYGKWQMNQLGYRGPEPVPGRINVVTFGASETIGLYESPGKEYPRQLETLLNANPSGPQYNVVNLGLFGMRIGRTSYLVRGIEQTQAKVAIIYPSPANYFGTNVPLCGQQTRPVASDMGPLDYLRIGGKAEQLFKKHAPEEVMTLLRQYGIWRATRETTLLDRVPESTIEALKADIACAARAAEQAGARVILVTHANYFGSALQFKDMPMMLAWRRFYPRLKEGGFLDLEHRTNTAVKELGVELNMPVVDAAASIPSGSIYFADFVHFTDVGSMQMAKLLEPIVVQLASKNYINPE